jgi:Cupin-like domain
MTTGPKAMTNPAFSTDAQDAFRALYPETPGKLSHQLAGHPLLSLEALVDLGGRLNPEHVEYNRADIPIGIDPAAVEANGLTIADTIRSIEENGSWMVLKWVENDPAYKALLEQTLSELQNIVQPLTGAMRHLQGFIFVSSPNAVTPFHMDPEHNILLQIRGNKVMTVFPADDGAIVNDVEHERYHLGGHRNLPWQDGFAARGTPFALAPGEAIHVPVKAPHWVKNGDALSISLSVTWRSEWSYRESEARVLNSVLRDVGLTPATPARYPQQNFAKAIAYRIAKRLPGVKQWNQ